ncbi:PadR family transcriptional regulator [Spiractinospora alimapuensis]|uniref:PadR family transcriptional regulator n=1 Tax=Spiractinospora alimapuensis TaxID=2820884 RepID=UPI002ED70112|nr:PadR family transcriptional regulator [Spiractinospora alimapuensis]
MANIFGHGRLRLYLLKLLDESPRHGYEIISLLRDRFLGVYSPSPGTIYPRLARLEEEGLVTHEEVNGRKVYRLTDAGREELNRRTEDISALENDLIDSAHEIARAVKRDVRDTITTLREELKGAANEARQRANRGERRGSEREETPTDENEDVWGRAASEESERESTRGAWWSREWEKVSRGFGSWGSTEWGSKPEFDRAMNDFSDRVRRVVQDAGQVGESTVENLRRILDDTVEVIRRDAADWGPRCDDTAGRDDTPATDEKPASDDTDDKKAD